MYKVFKEELNNDLICKSHPISQK